MPSATLGIPCNALSRDNSFSCSTRVRASGTQEGVMHWTLAQAVRSLALE